MNDTVIVALVSFAATLLTGLGGYKLIAYRVEQLEKKVEKHNGVMERTYGIEARIDVHDEQFKVSNHRLADLERKTDK